MFISFVFSLNVENTKRKIDVYIYMYAYNFENKLNLIFYMLEGGYDRPS